MPDYPFYPYYPKDLNGDHKVIGMDNRTYGAYRRLLDIAWHESPPATLPDNEIILAKYAQETLDGWKEIAPAILNCFIKHGNRWLQKRLRQEWAKIDAKHRKQSQAGKERQEEMRLLELVDTPQSSGLVGSLAPSLAGSLAAIRAYGSNSSEGVVGGMQGGNGSERAIAARVLAHLNQKAGKNFKPTEANAAGIIARLREGYTESDCFQVVDNRCERWLTHRPDELDMSEFLRPSTLFRPTKFPNYLADAQRKVLPNANRNANQVRSRNPDRNAGTFNARSRHDYDEIARRRNEADAAARATEAGREEPPPAV
jgi:uncharacterized phage protein (TIGR02220 family)